MSDNQQLDVLIAVYLIPDLAQQDFDAYVKLAGDGEIVTDGVALVVKDADGEVHVQETGDHLGRKGAKVGGGAGLVIGLFAPPLLAATAVGAAAGATGGEVRAPPQCRRASATRWTTRFPPGRPASSRSTSTTAPTLSRRVLANAIRTSTAQIDKASADELKAGLQEASAGLAG